MTNSIKGRLNLAPPGGGGGGEGLWWMNEAEGGAHLAIDGADGQTLIIWTAINPIIAGPGWATQIYPNLYVFTFTASGTVDIWQDPESSGPGPILVHKTSSPVNYVFGP
jgi:hypothetical protein